MITTLALTLAAATPAPHEPILFPTMAQVIAASGPIAVAAIEESGDAPAENAATTDAPAPAAEEPASGSDMPTDFTRAPATTLEVARRVAVYELELQGVGPNIGTVVTDSVLAEVRKLRGVAAIGMDEIKDMLSHEANKQILGCEADDACLAEIAGALGVDDLITGKLSKVGDNHVMLVRRIDQRRATVVGVFDKRLKAGSGQEFLLSVGPAIEELFAGRPLREGLSRGVAKEVALRLDPPPLPKLAFFGVAGGAALVGAVGGVFGLLALGEQSSYQTLAKSGTAITGSELVAHGSAAQDRALVANISYGTAGAMALAAGVMYLFTDWEGYADQTQD